MFWNRSLVLEHELVQLSEISKKDSGALDFLLSENRQWLSPWEATLPGWSIRPRTVDSIRGLIAARKAGTTIPFVIRYQGEIVGQLNVFKIERGSISSAVIGYWISESVAGKGITPIAVALATDYCLQIMGLNRVEIYIRTNNQPSLRVVEKLKYNYEGLKFNYFHIDGDWRDHFAFAVLAAELPNGLLYRYLSGAEVPNFRAIPESDLELARSRDN